MTTKRFSLFAIVMAAFVLLVGCKKEKEQENTIMQSSENISMTILSEIAKHSCELDFKTTVYKMIQARFDGDDNVLCKDVLSKTKDIEDGSIMEALQYYQQQGLFPQIYIPCYEELQERKTEENIIFINAIGVDESQVAFQGYCFENDTIVETPYLIDEEYAMNHEVWVISLNERVDENGNPIITGNYTDSINGPRNEQSQRSGRKYECVQKIKCPNLSEIEGWIKGAPELKCVCYSHKWGGNLTTQYFYPNKRKDINNVFWTVDNGYSRRMYYWNTTDISNYVNFLWIELDDSGSTTTLTNSYSIPLETGGTNNITYSVQIKEQDIDCGSFTPYYNDGRVGLSYTTGLVTWIDEYKN